MKFKPTYSSKSFCFSRWSRKAWAVFSGLHKVIKLGHLSAPVCELALIKSGLSDGNTIVLFNNKNCDSDISDIDDPLALIPVQFLFLSQILLSSTQKSKCFAGKPALDYSLFIYLKFWAKAQSMVDFFYHGLSFDYAQLPKAVVINIQAIFNFHNPQLFTYLLNPIFYGSARNL